jgi:hypothetical protein
MCCGAEMGMQDPVDDDFGLDLEPTSEVRAVAASARRLVIDTGLRGADAEAAWVTVTDERGAVFYEGTPSADGCIDVSFEGAPAVRTARVLLETARLHRTAEVELGEGWTAHAFTG